MIACRSIIVNGYQQIATVLVVCCVWLNASSESAAQRRLHSGSRFERQLKSPASIFWSQVPLQQALSDLSATRRMACWLDRRCDPNQPVTFGASLPSLADCLWRLSRESDRLNVVWLPNLIYVGPPNGGNRLATMNELHRRRIAQLPAPMRRRLQAKKNFHWPRLTTPAQLLAQLEKEVGLPISGKRRISHDLWAAGSFPPLPLYQRLELLLAGFGLTFEIDIENEQLMIVPMPKAPSFVERPNIGPDNLAAVHKVVSQHSNASFEDGNLSADWRVHEEVRRLLNPPAASADRTLVRYSLTVSNQPLENFVRSLCQQMNIECQFNNVEAKEKEARISFEVQRVTVRKLFDAIFSDTPLRYELNGDTLTVEPGDG